MTRRVKKDRFTPRMSRAAALPQDLYSAYGGIIGWAFRLPGTRPGMHTEPPANPFMNACEASDGTRHAHPRVYLVKPASQMKSGF